MLPKERPVVAPRFGEIFVESAVQWKQDLARFIDGLVGPVDAQPEHEHQRCTDGDAHGRMGRPQGAKEGFTLVPAPAKKAPERSCAAATGRAAARRTLVRPGRHAGRVAENCERVFKVRTCGRCSGRSRTSAPYDASDLDQRDCYVLAECSL